jgi:hypothetical protein
MSNMYAVYAAYRFLQLYTRRKKHDPFKAYIKKLEYEGYGVH